MAEALGHYVYLYVDPRDGKVFYIGKGRGERWLTVCKQRPKALSLELIVLV